MGRRRVEVEPVLLGVLAVVALCPGETKDPLFEDRVAAVPKGERETQELPVVADAGETVLVPPVGARASVVVGEEVPCGAVGAVVLAVGAPGPFAEVGSPMLPRRSTLRDLVEAG